MIKLKEIYKNILKELGEGNIQPFPYNRNFKEEQQGRNRIITLSFKDNKDRTIEIYFYQVPSAIANVPLSMHPKNLKEYEQIQIPENYYAIGYKIGEFTGSSSDDKQIDSGQYYLKLISTLVNIVKDFVKKYNPNGLAIIKTFADSNEKDTKFNNQKENIYKLWLTKALPGFKLRIQGKHLFFDKINLNEIKIIKNVTPEIVIDFYFKVKEEILKKGFGDNNYLLQLLQLKRKFNNGSSFIMNGIYGEKVLNNLNQNQLKEFYNDLLKIKNNL